MVSSTPTASLQIEGMEVQAAWPCRFRRFFRTIFICLFASVRGSNLVSLKKLYRSDFTGPSPAWLSQEMIEHTSHLCQSYYEQTAGSELLPGIMDIQDPEQRCRMLFLDMERVVVSHGTQIDGEGPILNYGNMCALKLWGASWEELTQMPSRRTAEPANQQTRDAFMKQVTENGIARGYEGVRIAINGKKRFKMMDASVWNIVIDGEFIGQAATFKDFEFLP